MTPGLDLQNQGAELKVRAYRRGGELLKDCIRHEGGRLKNGEQCSPFVPLRELGVSKKQFQHWQAIARIPEDDFERHTVGRAGRGPLGSVLI